LQAAINLYDYQKQALEKMKSGCILCGGVGSGKSRTGLAYYVSQGTQPLFIITTARKRDTNEWKEELYPFGISATVDSWNNIKKYANIKDSFFIFDEQRVVGRGMWVKSFLKIARNNKWILLSATPGDTWSDYVPVFIANGFFRNRTDFNEHHVIFSSFTKYPKIDRYVNEGLLIRFRNQILVNMDFKRQTVSHNETLISDYDEDLYKLVMRKRWDIWKDQPFQNAAELCYALRKIVNSDESRERMVLEIVEKHPKVIIFYNFDYELDALRNLAYGKDVEIAEWNGHKHEQLPSGDSWVYLVQYTAGAEGWNCTQTDTIIFYSQTYSYKTLHQASGRIDRLNTPFHDLYYYHIRSRAPIDLAIMRALRNKKTFNERGFVSGRG
jgi:superfamily II DNA or RNA helicase